jgi:WD40 repeat protein
VTGSVHAAVLDPHGGVLAVEDDGGTWLWDTRTDEVLGTLGVTGSAPPVFSPDGRTLATTGAAVQLWDAATGRLRTTLADGTGVRRVWFGGDGRTLVGQGGGTAPVRVWDLAPTAPAQAIRAICTTFASWSGSVVRAAELATVPEPGRRFLTDCASAAPAEAPSVRPQPSWPAFLRSAPQNW